MCFGTVVLLLTSLYFHLTVIFFLVGNGGVRVRTRYVYWRTNVPHKVNVGFFSLSSYGMQSGEGTTHVELFHLCSCYLQVGLLSRHCFARMGSMDMLRCGKSRLTQGFWCSLAIFPEFSTCKKNCLCGFQTASGF